MARTARRRSGRSPRDGRSPEVTEAQPAPSTPGRRTGGRSRAPAARTRTYPLTMSELIGTTFRTLTANLLPFLGLTLLWSLPALVYMGYHMATLDFDTAYQIYFVNKGQGNLTPGFIKFLSLFAIGGLCYGTVMYLSNRKAGFGAIFRRGLARFFPVLGVLLLFGAVMIIIALVLGFVLFRVQIPLLVITLVFTLLVNYLSALFMPALPAVVVERSGVFAALRRSMQLTRGYRMPIFLAFLAVGICDWICGQVLIKGLHFLHRDTQTMDTNQVYGYMVLVAAATLVFTMFHLILAAVAYGKCREKKEEASFQSIAGVFR